MSAYEPFDLIVGGDIAFAWGVKDIAAANNTGAWARLRDVKRLVVLISLAAGTGSEHVTVELQQAKDAEGDGAKVLQLSKLYYKAGADLTAIDSWTREDAISRKDRANSWVSSEAGAATLQLAVAVVIDEDDLDTNNDFAFVRLKIDDPGSARQGVAHYIAAGKRYAGTDSPGVNA